MEPNNDNEATNGKPEYDHRKIWGAGYHAGRRSVLGSDNAMSLSASQLKITVEQQSTNAKKVYSCVPATEAWTLARIASELGRTGIKLPHNIVQGCLRSLLDAGLIREVQRDLFSRVKARESPPVSLKSLAKRKLYELENEPPPIPTAARVEPPPMNAEPLDNIGKQTAALRALSATLAQLADNIDAAALSFQQFAETHNERLKDLDELQSLLSRISKKEGV